MIEETDIVEYGGHEYEVTARSGDTITMFRAFEGPDGDEVTEWKAKDVTEVELVEEGE